MAAKKQTPQKPRRRRGALQGKIHMADDFDELGPRLAQQCGVLAGVDPDLLSQIEPESSMEGAKRPELKILAAVKPRFGSAQAALNWYRTDPLPGFSGETAEQLVHAGRGEEVLLYIQAVDAGIHS